ncbi:dimethyladenosine transferase 2, mitochondrial [Narcine bancroftii]|uniref:dimethyladenosine transferase 2, mitochondrial n=1 Tax=Narcine bancroftii TaxID=1343680 RepID=UPI0038320BA8
MLSCNMLLCTLKTVTCRACVCWQLHRSISRHIRFPGNVPLQPPFLHQVKEYSTYCDRTQRYLSALARSLLKKEQRPLSRIDFLDMEEVEEIINNAEKRQWIRRFITNPDLANLIVECIDSDLPETNVVIFECNPGPGVLTRALLNGGAQRIVALESDKQFIPALQSLERHLNGQLEVVHCDFFKLDPIGHGMMKPPAMFSEKLFNDLGISDVAWTADIPVKVVGIIPQRNERNMLWKLIYALFERISIFQYGRIEINLFISEKEYLKLMAEPGNMKHYQAFSALWQMACEIELLHKEPWSSFATYSKNGGRAKPQGMMTNDHLCLVRLTPRRDLFNQTFTPANSATLVLMLKQCLAKRRAKLVDKLESWCPGSGGKLMMQLDLPENILTGHVFPEEYKKLFEAMERSQDFRQSWLFEEVLENLN